jgi:hypothetical protein
MISFMIGEVGAGGLRGSSESSDPQQLSLFRGTRMIETDL